MNTKKLLSFIMVLMLAINVSAESFTYFNRGIAFKCKVNDGKAIITGFDNKAAMVVIPAQVKDKRGHTLQVSTVDLGQIANLYKKSELYASFIKKLRPQPYIAFRLFMLYAFFQ